VIIYQDTKSGFLHDIAENHFQARIESAFFHKTGSVPSDSRGWASDYSRFADAQLSASLAPACCIFQASIK